jgi:hypothetical protein
MLDPLRFPAIDKTARQPPGRLILRFTSRNNSDPAIAGDLAGDKSCIHAARKKGCK